MKQIMIIGTALLALAGSVQAQNGIDQVLRTIETNNKELKANAQWVTSQKLASKAENNLSNPSVSFAHLWHSEDKGKTVGELVVSQGFDFPSLYVTRHKLNRLKAGSFDSQAAVLRQDVLLKAKELCLDIIMLRQQKQILQERLSNVEELSQVFNKRLQTGEGSSLETNKIRLELLNIRTEASLNETALRNKMQALTALNGNVPVTFEDNNYPVCEFPTNYQVLQSDVIASDRALLALNNESMVARKEITLNKSKWLPSFQVGYKRNHESGTPLNGFMVGISLPIFENHGKVKVAKMQAMSLDLQKENATLQLEAELAQLYQEAQAVHASMKEYQETLQGGTNLELLKKALTGGQISMIEYFVEVAVIYQSHLNYIQLENQYQKAMAKIYKSKL